VQLRGTGAAGTGVGGKKPAWTDHAQRIVVVALDYGGSGAGRDAIVSGGAGLLRAAATQETSARGAGSVGAQAADGGICHAARWRRV